MRTVPIELLEALSRRAEKARDPESPGRGFAKKDSVSFDLEKWIKNHNLNVLDPSPWKGGRRWIFEICPWNPEHRNRSAFIIQLANGAVAAGCQHSSCRDKGWHDLRDIVEPGWRANSSRHDSARPAGPDAWTPVIPFHQAHLPPFPCSSLPDWLRRFVETEATATQTPPDLPAMLALAVIAAACAKKVAVRIKPDHIEPLNIFVVVALPPANRKSAVFSAVTKPLEEFENSEVKRHSVEIARQQSARKIKENRLKKLEQQAADASGGDGDAASAAEQLAAELAQTPSRCLPRYLADDCTPERLAGILAEQRGRIAIMSAEGEVFDMMAGRYSSNSSVMGNLAVYLKGHAGDQLRVDRVGRPTEFVDSPALTLGLAVQPEVIRGLIGRPGFRGRGLLGRFLYAIPKSLIGYREIDPAPVPDQIREEYHTNIAHLLTLPTSANGMGLPTSHLLNLDHDAQDRMREFQAWVEPQLAEFGELGTMSDWAGKLAGAVGRIAGILHMSAFAGEDAPWETPIPGATLEHAIKIGTYLISHAQAAFAEMGADAIQDAAKRILRWIEHVGLDRFSKRELHQALKGTFKRVDELDAPLALLETHSFFRKEPELDRAGVGRRPSPIYEVNPLWSPQNPHNTRNSAREINFEDSENCENRGSAHSAGV